MKNLFSVCILALLSIMVISFSSCGDDTCEQADWVGNYSGDATETVDGEESMGTATVTITADGTDNISVSYTYVVNNTENTISFDPFGVTGCDISQTASDPSSGIDIDLSMNLDGDDLTLETVLSGNADAEVTITATK